MSGLDIGIDIDDVLFRWSDHAQAACDDAGISKGLKIDRWNFEETFGITRDELWEVLFDSYREGMLYDNAPYEGVGAVLGALQEVYGHRVHLVTARGFEGQLSALVRQDTVEWLHRFDISHTSLSFMQNKALLKVDAFLDDSPSNCFAMWDSGTPTVALRAQPHNEVTRLAVPFHIVDDLLDFATLIEPTIIQALDTHRYIA